MSLTNFKNHKADSAGKFLCASLLLAILFFETPALLHAQDWMFQRSYYSHHETASVRGPRAPHGQQFLNAPHNFPVPATARTPKPESRSAYRTAIVGRGRQYAVRGGYRYNFLVMRNGNSSDVTVLRENWIEYSP